MSNSRRLFETRQQQQSYVGKFREQLLRYPYRSINEFYDCMNMRQWLARRGLTKKHPHWRSWMENQKKLRLSITRKLP